MTHSKPYIIVALDLPTESKALTIVEQLNPEQCRLKIGKEMFTRYGPDLVKTLIAKGFEIFLDLKYHDIPNTVTQACIAAAELGVWMVNVHALGGGKMLQAARDALEKTPGKRPLLIGVTILTSMTQQDLPEIGLAGTLTENVLILARLSQKYGLDGVVCSAAETTLIRNQLGEDFCLVTPGIRPLGSNPDDQQRIMTPTQAITAGSNYLVIGRPITQAVNPQQMVEQITAEFSLGC